LHIKNSKHPLKLCVTPPSQHKSKIKRQKAKPTKQKDEKKRGTDS
jgi:hypothetical protein